jgi:hypothetical protein
VVISISSGSWERLTFFKLPVEIWGVDRVAPKGDWEAGLVTEGSSGEAAGFFGPYVCLGVFLLL